MRPWAELTSYPSPSQAEEFGPFTKQKSLQIGTLSFSAWSGSVIPFLQLQQVWTIIILIKTFPGPSGRGYKSMLTRQGRYPTNQVKSFPRTHGCSLHGAIHYGSLSEPPIFTVFKMHMKLSSFKALCEYNKFSSFIYRLDTEYQLWMSSGIWLTRLCSSIWVNKFTTASVSNGSG